MTTWAANGLSQPAEPNTPGFNSEYRTAEINYFHRGQAHYERLRFLQRQEGDGTDNIENRVAARRLLERWEARGPKYLFLGPEIQDWNPANHSADLIEPQRAWDLRVEENDQRAPMLSINWARMGDLRGLFM